MNTRRPEEAHDDAQPEAFSLRRLLQPVSPEAFFSTYWEKQPLHIQRRDAHFHDELLTQADIEQTISSGGLRYPAIQLSRAGAFLPPEAFCRDIRSGGVTFTGVPDMDRVQVEYKSGATLSLPGFHRAWKPLGALAAAVEDQLDHAVHTNIYLTPPSSPGFNPHYDTHDVFVLQISGVKHWKIYRPLFELPHQSQPFHPQMLSALSAPLELDLEPGDLLYLPRGFIHTTNTLDAFSTHVTLGVTVYTFVEILAAWLQSSKNETAFRRALPVGFAHRPELKEQVIAEFSTMLAELHRKLGADMAVSGFLERVKEGYPGKNAVRSGFDAASAIGASARLKAPDRALYAIEDGGENIVLKFAGKTVALPRVARSTLMAICQRPSFSVAELPADLNAEARLALVRRLYHDGFLTALE